MLKKVIGLLIVSISFQTSHGMEQVWESVKNAVSGPQKRDYLQEIAAVESDASLTEIIKLRKKASLYIKLRNENRGKEDYVVYNERAEQCRKEASILEQEERIAAAEAKRKQDILDREKEVIEQIRETRKDSNKSHLARVHELAGFYSQLADLFENEDETKFKMYQTRLTQFQNKTEYLFNYEELEKTTDRVEKISLLDKLAGLCDRVNPERANEHRLTAQQIRDELQAEANHKAHEELVGLLVRTTDKTLQAQLCRKIAEVCDDIQVGSYRAQAEKLEQEAQEEQRQQELTITKIARIQTLSAQITETDSNATLAPHLKLGKLADLLQERLNLSEGIAKFEADFAGDARRIGNLRRQAIGSTQDVQLQQSNIALIKYH